MNLRRKPAFRVALLSILQLGLCLSAEPSVAQPRKPTAKEVAAIRDCAAKAVENVDEGEERCLFKLVADPCLNTSAGSTVADADCYRVEGMIWDDLLNENYKNLLGALDDNQTAKARAMQRAWLTYRDTTCQFYYDKIQGTMAVPMESACITRETARRALLLKFLSGL